MARGALRGVKDVTRTANEIADSTLDRRVPLGSTGGELDQLACTFNAMLDRIRTLIIGMRDMADNLTHDLSSPLGRIRACAEMSMASGDGSDACESWAANTVEECDRLLEMLNTTLDIAEADSGAARLAHGRMDLTEVVLSACELSQAVAEDSRIGMSVSVPDHCWIEGGRQRLQRVVANLIDNALKYTLPGGAVTVALRNQGQYTVLTIADTGVGIAADDLPRIFQCFYRCDPSRSQPGIGLGLSPAMAFVRAHGGDISVASTRGEGSTFTVTPSRSPARQPVAKPEWHAHARRLTQHAGTAKAIRGMANLADRQCLSHAALRSAG